MSAPLSPRSRRAQSFDQTTHQGSDAHAPPTIPELIRSKSSEEVWVDVAETGDSFCAYVVNRHTADAQDTFSHFAQQLERGSGIPRASLIILAGPPFKSYSRGVPPQGVAKVYLYDKRCLGRAAHADVTSSQGLFTNALLSRPPLPTEPVEVVDSELERLSDPKGLMNLPPLLRTLPMYERHSMLCLNKGQHYLSEALRRKELCEAWLLARQRQRSALAAAVGNLLDHFAGAAREYRKVATQLGQQQAHSQRLLSGFDEALAVLRSTPLHPTLVPLLNGPSGSSSTSSSAAVVAATATTLPPDDAAAITSASADEREPAGAREGSATRRAAEEPEGAESTAATAATATATHVVTLADLVPTDKYGPYVAQCTLSAQRLQQSSAELDALFTRLDAGVARQQQAMHSETEAAEAGGGATDGSQSNCTIAAVAGDTSRTNAETTRGEREGALGLPAVAAEPSRSVGDSNRDSAAEAGAIVPLSSTFPSAKGVGDPSSHVPVEPFEEGQPFAVELAYLQQQVVTVKDLARLQSALAAKVERDYGDARAAVVYQLKEVLEPNSSTAEPSPRSPAASGSSMQGSVLLRSAVDELEQVRCSAEANDLPKLATQDALQLAAAQRVAQRLEVGAREMRQRLAQVSQLQRSIVNLQQHVKLRAEALRQQRDDFVHLEAVHKLPHAYSSFLAEVQRRCLAAQHADKLTATCEAQLATAYAKEVAVRERFLARHGPYLPPPFAQVLVPSLFQKPPRVRLDKGGVPPQLPDLSPMPPPRAAAATSTATTDAATAGGVGPDGSAGVHEGVGSSSIGGGVYGAVAEEEEEEEEEETLLVEADEDEVGLEDPALEVLQLRAKCAALEIELAHARQQQQLAQARQQPIAPATAIASTTITARGTGGALPVPDTVPSTGIAVASEAAGATAVAESPAANPTELASPQSAAAAALAVAAGPQMATRGGSSGDRLPEGTAAMCEVSRWAQVLEAQLNQLTPPAGAEGQGYGTVGGGAADSGSDRSGAALATAEKTWASNNGRRGSEGEGSGRGSAASTTAEVASSVDVAASVSAERLARLLERVSSSLASTGAAGTGVARKAGTEDDDDDKEEEAVISFRRFRPGNLVLFLPVYPKKAAASASTTNAASGSSSESNDAPGLVYLAFNEACPRHYLSQESAAFFRARNAGKPPHFIVGRVIVIDSLVAGPRGSNCYDLAEGAAYHVITVESV